MSWTQGETKHSGGLCTYDDIEISQETIYEVIQKVLENAGENANVLLHDVQTKLAEAGTPWRTGNLTLKNYKKAGPATVCTFLYIINNLKTRKNSWKQNVVYYSKKLLVKILSYTLAVARSKKAQRMLPKDIRNIIDAVILADLTLKEVTGKTVKELTDEVVEKCLNKIEEIWNQIITGESTKFKF